MKHNQLLKLISSFLVAMFIIQLSTASYVCANCRCKSKTYTPYNAALTLYLPRPQQLNSAVLFNPYYYPADKTIGLPDGFFTLGYRYQQTFKSTHIAECLFGSNSINFSGSHADGQNGTDWMADNFGLAPNFKSKLTFDPDVKNHIIDFSGRIQLDQFTHCHNNWYIGLAASLVNSSWNLNACEQTTAPTNPDYSYFPSCYMSNNQTPYIVNDTTTPYTVAPLISPISATNDIRPALSGNYLFGDMQTAWRWGKFVLNQPQTSTALANIDMILGYDFIRCNHYHLGLFAKASAPTGTRPDATTVFQPIIGNGHHWELGFGFDGHCNLLHCDDQYLQFYFNGNLTHLFTDTQWRTFDLKPGFPIEDGPSVPGLGSHYLLLKEFNQANKYTGNMINAVNFLTRKIQSSFDIQGDLAIRFLFTKCNFSAGIGYDVYWRSKESLRQTERGSHDWLNKNYGIKGVNGTCAKAFDETDGFTGNIYHLNSTSSKVRMSGLTTDAERLVVDNPKDSESPDYLTWDSPTSPIGSLLFAEDSVKNNQSAPMYVTNNDIDFKEIPSQLSHMVFGHLSYHWTEHCTQPYVEIGGSVEFAQNGSCKVCTANQWGVWISGGINF